MPTLVSPAHRRPRGAPGSPPPSLGDSAAPSTRRCPRGARGRRRLGWGSRSSFFPQPRARHLLGGRSPWSPGALPRPHQGWGDPTASPGRRPLPRARGPTPPSEAQPSVHLWGRSLPRAQLRAPQRPGLQPGRGEPRGTRGLGGGGVGVRALGAGQPQVSTRRTGCWADGGVRVFVRFLLSLERNRARRAKETTLTMTVPTEKAAIRQAMPRGRRQRGRGGDEARRRLGRGGRDEAALAAAPLCAGGLHPAGARAPRPAPRPDWPATRAGGAGARALVLLLLGAPVRAPPPAPPQPQRAQPGLGCWEGRKRGANGPSWAPLCWE